MTGADDDFGRAARGGIGFYDPKSDRMFLGFGKTGSGEFQDWGVVGY